MTDYWLSFRIDQESLGSRTSDQRRKAIYAEIAKMDSKAWVDTTSFVLFSSDKNIDAIANLLKVFILPKLDILLIRKVNEQDARAVGNHANLENLKRFMSYVEVK